MNSPRGFIILDFGSQLTQLIARRLRESGYFAEILPFHIPTEEILRKKPFGIILSGGPSSVYESGAPTRETRDLLKIAPVMGICYGMQLLAHQLGGRVHSAQTKEYGFNQVQWNFDLKKEKTLQSDLNRAFADLKTLLASHGLRQRVWMSHGDIVDQAPEGCFDLAYSESKHLASYFGKILNQSVFAIQFHPEVVHTEFGDVVLNIFAQQICQAEKQWNSKTIFERLRENILEKVSPEDHVLVGLSGGVDSSVVATLLTQVLGAERVHCVFVNNGLLRKNEYDEVLEQYRKVGLNVHGFEGSQLFLNALKGVSDPETKRKIIGKIFIDCFDQAMEPLIQAKKNIQWLAQGTLYPDVIESVSFHGGPSQTIKSHHNVGGLPEKMKLRLLEPVRELFKDEVRNLGRGLGLSESVIGRHPFPGPGLAIRIIGEINEESLRVLREADAIFINKLREHNLYHKIWQAFCVLLPVKTVGVQGDGRSYSQVLSLRAVTSLDGMTADWYPFEFAFLREVSNEITNKVRGINRVVYDITSKPPATIEWE